MQAFLSAMKMHTGGLPGPVVSAVAFSAVFLHALVLGALFLLHPAPAFPDSGQGTVFISMIPGTGNSSGSAGGASRTQERRDAISKADSPRNARARKAEPVSSSPREAPSENRGEAGGKGAAAAPSKEGKGDGADAGAGGGAEGTGGKSVGLSQLNYRRKVRPEYPERSRARSETGSVFVRIVVWTDGLVREAGIAQSSGHERLDHAALQAARESTFHPYVENGAPRVAVAIIPYHFRLNASRGK